MIFHSLHWPAIFSLQHDATLRWLSVNRIIREITNKSTILFFPIFLFSLGQSLPFLVELPDWMRGILLVVGYQLVLRFLIVIGILPLSRFMARSSISSTLVLSYLFRCLFFAILTLAADKPVLLLLAVIMEAVEVSLFWSRYNTLLAQHSRRLAVGSNLGVIQFLMQLLGVMAPLLAVLLGAAIGSSAVFLLGIVGSLVGLLTALQITFPVEKDTVSVREFWHWLKEYRYHRYVVAVGGRMINDVVLSLWPLYIFLLLGSVVRVGYLATVSLLLALVVTVIAGLQFDKLRSAKAFYVSGGILALVWLARTQVITPLGIALADSVDKVVSTSHWLFFDMILFRRSQGSQTFSFFVYHEIVANTWMIVVWLVVLVILLVSQSWQALFVLGSSGALLSVFLRGKHSQPVS